LWTPRIDFGGEVKVLVDPHKDSHETIPLIIFLLIFLDTGLFPTVFHGFFFIKD